MKIWLCALVALLPNVVSAQPCMCVGPPGKSMYCSNPSPECYSCACPEEHKEQTTQQQAENFAREIFTESEINWIRDAVERAPSDGNKQLFIQAASQARVKSNLGDLRLDKETGKMIHTPCTDFVVDTLKAAGIQLSASDERAVKIWGINQPEGYAPVMSLKDYALNYNDFRVTGAPGVLVSNGEATEVPVRGVAPGDIVQYWEKRRDGTLYGHAGFVGEVLDYGKVRLIDSTPSRGPLLKGTTVDLRKVERATAARLP